MKPESAALCPSACLISPTRFARFFFDHEGVGPETVLKIGLGHGLGTIGDEELEQLERLGREADAFGAPSQLAGTQIQYEVAKGHLHGAG